MISFSCQRWRKWLFYCFIFQQAMHPQSLHCIFLYIVYSLVQVAFFPYHLICWKEDTAVGCWLLSGQHESWGFKVDSCAVPGIKHEQFYQIVIYYILWRLLMDIWMQCILTLYIFIYLIFFVFPNTVQAVFTHTAHLVCKNIIRNIMPCRFCSQTLLIVE